MLLFISQRMNRIIRYLSFNTSHVTLYLTAHEPDYPILKFQYISCYSLSLRKRFLFYLCTRFNTSHVTLYRRTDRKLSEQFYVSIHLMLLFIIFMKENSIWKFRFNTSHVTLYQEFDEDDIICALFQYISCYSLSRLDSAGRFIEEMFQYISCYSLSGSGECCSCNKKVSIHLMLLFIEMSGKCNLEAIRFQYISCYSLSEISLQIHGKIQRFNTSHVTLYLGIGKMFDVANEFQYISCYSLSHLDTSGISSGIKFQYISCYSLSVKILHSL